jgi:hypothetical protein
LPCLFFGNTINHFIPNEKKIMLIEDSVCFDQVFDFSDFDVSSSDEELVEMKFIQNLNGNGEDVMRNEKT